MAIRFPTNFTQAASQLMPKLESRMAAEIYKLSAGLEGKLLEFPSCVIGEYLILQLVLDDGQAYSYVTREAFENWGISFDEALGVAIDNLRARTPPDFCQTVGLEHNGVVLENFEGVYAARAGPLAYNATRILLTDYIGRCKVKGDIIAFVPNDERLIISGSDNQLNSAVAWGWIEDAKQHNCLLCPFMFKLQQGEWHRVRSLNGLLAIEEVNYLGSAYNAQRKLLQKMNERNGLTDITVAELTAHKYESSGKIISACIWEEGKEILLPETDEIFFATAGSDGQLRVITRAPWSRIIEVCGDLLEPLSIFPPRYRVIEFPSIERLRLIS